MFGIIQARYLTRLCKDPVVLFPEKAGCKKMQPVVLSTNRTFGTGIPKLIPERREKQQFPKLKTINA